MKFLPLNFLSTRTHHIWPRFSLSAMCYEGILNVENLERELEWLTHQENTESVSPLRHLQSRSGKIFCQAASRFTACNALPTKPFPHVTVLIRDMKTVAYSNYSDPLNFQTPNSSKQIPFIKSCSSCSLPHYARYAADSKLKIGNKE